MLIENGIRRRPIKRDYLPSQYNSSWQHKLSYEDSCVLQKARNSTLVDHGRNNNKTYGSLINNRPQLSVNNSGDQKQKAIALKNIVFHPPPTTDICEQKPSAIENTFSETGKTWKSLSEKSRPSTTAVAVICEQKPPAIENNFTTKEKAWKLLSEKSMKAHNIRKANASKQKKDTIPSVGLHTSVNSNNNSNKFQSSLNKFTTELSMTDEGYKKSQEQMSKMQSLKHILDNRPDTAKIIPTFMEECQQFSIMYNWSKIIKEQLDTNGINDHFFKWFGPHYLNSKEPSNVNISDIYHSITSLTSSQGLYFKNYNDREREKYRRSQDYSNDELPLGNHFGFNEPITLTEKTICSFLYHIGIYSMFDFGFQVVHHNEMCLKNDRDNTFFHFVEKFSLKFGSLKAYRHNSNETQSKVEWCKFNFCPICKNLEKFHNRNQTGSIIATQLNMDSQFCESDGNLCKKTRYSNSGLYQHMVTKKDCWLHFLLMKYLEYSYGDICRQFNKRKKTKCKQSYMSKNLFLDKLQSLMSIYSLTR